MMKKLAVNSLVQNRKRKNLSTYLVKRIKSVAPPNSNKRIKKTPKNSNSRLKSKKMRMREKKES